MAHVRVESIQPDPPPRKVILELTEEEAAVVYILIGATEVSEISNSACMSIYEELKPCFPKYLHNFNPWAYLEMIPKWRAEGPPLPRLKLAKEDAS